ncbi:hypothetical protein CJ177_31145 [Rhodococcus sp. ACPA1]|nr:hypothetical protein CJ177_31145 [Rhodococcus sp. ACPA1]
MAAGDDPADLAAPRARSPLDPLHAPHTTPAVGCSASEELVGAATADTPKQDHLVAEPVVGQQRQQPQHRHRTMRRRCDERIAVFAQVHVQLAGIPTFPCMSLLQQTLRGLDGHIRTGDLP